MGTVIHVVCPHCGATNRLPGAKLAAGPRCGRCKNALFTGRPIELGGTDFDRHLSAGDLPLVVDFWAPWCGPCRMMAPDFERAAALLEPGIRLAKVDTEREAALASRHGIRGVPTVIVFNKGKEVARRSGAMNLTDLTAWIRSVI